MKKIHFAICGLVAAMIACQTDSAPPTQLSVSNTPSIQTSSPADTDCKITVASYDLPHAATDIAGKELYDLATTEPSDTYLSVSATVTEAQHLVSASDGVDGTLILSHIDDPEGNNIHQYFILLYLPDGGEAISQMSVDTRISVSGPYVGYVYPPKNLFTAFPNENEDTKFPSIKAETASYGCL